MKNRVHTGWTFRTPGDRRTVLLRDVQDGRQQGQRYGYIFPLECLGYCYNYGGGKPTPPKVNLVQYSGSLACTEQEALCHYPVRQGGGKEAQKAGGGGAKGYYRGGLTGLQVTVGDRDVI